MNACNPIKKNMNLLPVKECRIMIVLSRVIVLFALLGLSIGGCKTNSDPDGKAASELVVGLEGNPTLLDPRVAQDAYSQRILPLVFEGLLELDQNSEPTPLLASSWEARDELTYIFHLDPGHRCPNGTEIKASDVVYTIESLADPSLRSPHKVLFDKIDEIRAIDDFTVFIRLKEAYAPFLTDLVMGIVPADAAKQSGKDFGRRPFGSGPYQVESFEPGGAVVLVENPGYHGPRPAIEKVIFRVIPDDVTRVLALERGEVHLLQNSVPPDDLALLKKNPGLLVTMEPGVNYSYLGFNLEDPILSDLEVRQAISYAIDREKIAGCLLRDTVTLASGIMAPSHWAYNPNVKKFDYDPETAKRLLDKSGHPDPDDEGPLPRFRLVYKTSQNKTRRWMAEAIADQLKEVGIEVEVSSHEWGTFFADIKSGNFQMYSLTWVGVTDPDIYYIVFHSQSMPPHGANRNRYSNPEFDRLAEAGRKGLTRKERSLAYSRAQEIVARELPYVSLWYNNNIVARDKRLKGFVINPAGDYRSLARARWEMD